MSWDVVIVGAGPGGSAAAIQLARSGCRVVVLEKAAMPREKACGDGLTRRAIDVIDSLLVDVPELLAVDRVRLCSDPSGGEFFEWPHPKGAGAMVMRLVLDDRLAQAAVASGAELRTCTTAEALIVEDGVVRGVKARTLHGSEDVRARLTILASGASSAIGRWAPTRSVRRTGFAVRSYFEGVRWRGPPAFDIVIPIDSPKASVAGYGWVFPLQGGRANVGVGFFQPPNGRRIPLHDLLNAFEERLVRQDPRFADARRASRPLGAALASGGSPADALGRGLLLVGDAAGLGNPYSGEGISQALESGALAADVASAVLAGRATTARYADLLAGARLARRGVEGSLPTLYRCIARCSRDFVSMMRTGTEPTRWLWDEFSGMRRQPSSNLAPDPTELAALARRATQRARRMALRERPLLNDIVGRFDLRDEAEKSTASIFLRARAALPGFHPTPEIRKAATCLELLRIAVVLLDDTELDLDASQRFAVRGGQWAAATLALCLGDSILARAISVASGLSDPARGAMSEAILEVMTCLSADARDGVSPSSLRRIALLAVAAARAGTRIGEATGKSVGMGIDAQ